jgi:hypothetical protein
VLPLLPELPPLLPELVPLLLPPLPPPLVLPPLEPPEVPPLLPPLPFPLDEPPPLLVDPPSSEPPRLLAPEGVVVPEHPIPVVTTVTVPSVTRSDRPILLTLLIEFLSPAGLASNPDCTRLGGIAKLPMAHKKGSAPRLTAGRSAHCKGGSFPGGIGK